MLQVKGHFDSRVVLEVDRQKIASNYLRIKHLAQPAEVMCVLKADGYGLGATNCAKVLFDCGCRRFAVADAAEALELVDLFKPFGNVAIQILSSVLASEIPEVVKNGIVLPVYDAKMAALISESAIKNNLTATVHFKVDTGMGRLGATLPKAIENLREIAKLPSLQIEGALSHLSSAGNPLDPTSEKQVDAFKEFLESAANIGITFKVKHIAATDAILNLPNATTEPFNLVRVGLGLYGGFSSAALKAGLECAFKLKSRIVQVKEMQAGDTVGYSHTATLSRDSRIAIVAAGYADGVPLSISNKGAVVLCGKFCPVVGRVSMDYTAIDVTDVPNVSVGDEVILLGEAQGRFICPSTWADLKATHVYEIMTSIGNRVERKFEVD